MARFKNHLLVVVGFAFAGAIGAAFGTGTAQAVVSTLVSVVNPGTGPMHTSSVDDPGRIPYQSTVRLNAADCSGNFFCNFVFPTVPTGHRVVIQHVSGYFVFTVAVSAPVLVVVTDNQSSNNLSHFLAPTATALALFDQPVLVFVDQGDSLSVESEVDAATSFSGATQEVTITGYELDCTVAACAPIATQ